MGVRPDEMRAALAVHGKVLRSAIETMMASCSSTLATVYAAFASPGAAIEAANRWASRPVKPNFATTITSGRCSAVPPMTPTSLTRLGGRVELGLCMLRDCPGRSTYLKSSLGTAHMREVLGQMSTSIWLGRAPP